MNSKLAFYILKRVLLALFTIFLVITITFFAMKAVPGGPFLSEKAISEEAQAEAEKKYGLDKPLMEQYFTYVKDIVTEFDFGPSIKQRGFNVTEIIITGMKTSIPLGLAAAGIALIVGVLLGSAAALRRNTFFDKSIMVTMTAFVSMPSYKSGNEYKDYCFPCTKEFKREFDEAVLDAYHQQLSQKDGMQKDEAPTPEEAKARQGLAMTM